MHRIVSHTHRGAAFALALVAACPIGWAVPARADDPGPDLSLEAIVAEANQEREDTIRERERRVADAETRLAAMRAEVQDLVARNEALRAELGERAAQVTRAESEQLTRTIKVYEAMEPEEAAGILDGMAEPVALAIFGGMKGRAAAGIMAFMPKDKAARLGERLAWPR